MIAYTFIGEPYEYLPGVPQQSLDADELPALAEKLGLTERQLRAQLDDSSAYRRTGKDEGAASHKRTAGKRKSAKRRAVAQAQQGEPSDPAPSGSAARVEATGPHTPVDGDAAPAAEPKKP